MIPRDVLVFVLVVVLLLLLVVVVSRVAHCSCNRTVVYAVCRSDVRLVCLSVCVSGKCTVAKRLIGSGCRLGW